MKEKLRDSKCLVLRVMGSFRRVSFDELKKPLWFTMAPNTGVDFSFLGK